MLTPMSRPEQYQRQLEELKFNMTKSLNLSFRMSRERRGKPKRPTEQDNAELLAEDSIEAIAAETRNVLLAKQRTRFFSVFHKKIQVDFDPLSSISLKELLSAKVELKDPVIEIYCSQLLARKHVQKIFQNVTFGTLADNFLRISGWEDFIDETRKYYATELPMLELSYNWPNLVVFEYFMAWLKNEYGQRLLETFSITDPPEQSGGMLPPQGGK